MSGGAGSGGRWLVIGGDHPLVGQVAAAIAGSAAGSPVETLSASQLLAEAPGAGAVGLAVYLPAANLTGELPAPEEIAAVLDCLARDPGGHRVLVSSAEAYEPSHHHAGHLSEARLRPQRNANPIAGRWRALEAAAKTRVGADRLTILRPAWVPVAGGRDYPSRLFGGRLAVTVTGHDPTLQLLSPRDLAQAVRLAVERRRSGAFNVAPAGAVPLRRGLRLAGRRRLPLPVGLQRLARRLVASPGRVASGHQMEYIRYPWTVSGDAIRERLGFEPRDCSAAALATLRAGGEPPASDAALPRFDDFGLDREYIDFWGRVLHRFVHDYYWRVELDGVERLPRRGPAVLVGTHRGFMPFDGLMAVHAVVRATGRYPRFLLHPTLVKFPVLADFMTKMGGVLACRENAERVLADRELLGVYPEGIQGAFCYYREAYRLKKFGSHEFIRSALRRQAPILPFVTVGSAEIFPILGKIYWRWWIRYSEWPCLPITPTFPLLPLPLPSKWHTRFLEPMPVHRSHPPEAADDPAVVAAIGAEVRRRMQSAIDEMRGRRPARFWGNLSKEAA